MIELYQAEWCPYSHRVRERLTELGLDFVAHQVEPRQADREAMRAAVGTDSIPLLVDRGETFRDADEILAYLNDRYAPGRWERGHQAQERAHGDLQQGASRGAPPAPNR